jgi:hypothetical protein
MLLVPPSVSPVWSVFLVVPLLILFAPQPVRFSRRRMVALVASVGVLITGTICASCTNCDPWWLEHFWICLPR